MTDNDHRAPHPNEITAFLKACRALRKLRDAGWFLYLDGSGNMCLMSGPSHDGNGHPRRDRVVLNDDCGATGGDW